MIRKHTRSLTCLVLAVVLAVGMARSGGGAPRPTRADLEAERRRVSMLESEAALAATRKPYLVLDLGAGTLRYRLMGMTTREVALQGVQTEGLAEADGAATSSEIAGIFTLREKEGDPRLKPLSPEQVEAGADDENAANILPPEPPKAYRLSFRQPVAVRVVGRESSAGVKGVWAELRDRWRRWWRSESAEEARLTVSVVLDAGTAAEVYRSLLPDQHWLVLPPDGFVLPAAGQEAPPKPKQPRPTPAKPAKPVEPPGVPFRIPPPVDDTGAHGSDAQDGVAPNGGGERPPAIPPQQPPPPPTPEPHTQGGGA